MTDVITCSQPECQLAVSGWCLEDSTRQKPALINESCIRLLTSRSGTSNRT